MRSQFNWDDSSLNHGITGRAKVMSKMKPKSQGSSLLAANLAPKGLLLGCLSFMLLRKASGRIGASVLETLLQSTFN